MSDPLAAALDALHAAQLERVALAAQCRDAYQRGGLAAFLDAFADFARIAGDTDVLADAVLTLARRAVADAGHRA
jgi:hypothetical protein